MRDAGKETGKRPKKRTVNLTAGSRQVDDFDIGKPGEYFMLK